MNPRFVVAVSGKGVVKGGPYVGMAGLPLSDFWTGLRVDFAGWFP